MIHTSSGPPEFALTRNDLAVVVTLLDRTGTPSEVPAVAEAQPVGFMLQRAEPDAEYRVRVGNALPGDAAALSSEAAVVTGRRFGPVVLWETQPYFESARGLTWVTVESRSAVAPDWRPRATLRVAVQPSKLGEARYERMADDLRGLAAGLVFDLVSKSVVHLGPGSAASEPPSRVASGSSQLELRRLEDVWRQLAPALAEVERDPATRLERVVQPRYCWGGERLTPRALRTLTAAGVDPRRTARPFRAAALVTQESTNTVEHERIVAVLHVLRGRAQACAGGAAGQRRRLEEDRGIRDLAVHGEPSLWETVDRPRVERLVEAERRATALADAAGTVTDRPYLRDVTPAPGPLRTPVFDHVPAYRHVRTAAERLFRGSLTVADDAGEAEQVKSTSRMYEQWVFLQLVAAFRRSGLRTDSVHQVVRAAGWQRYTLDLERGARVSFRVPDSDLAVVLRYEPWVFPRETARARRESVYRGRVGAAPWSPDVLLEVLAPTERAAQAPEVVYAIVVDAKYSRTLTDAHWDGSRRYLDIKATHTDRQVVRQVWLAHPDPQGEITPHDSDVEWVAGELQLPRGDHLLGVLPLTPDDRERDAMDDLGDMAPTETALEFARGMLRYLNLAS